MPLHGKSIIAGVPGATGGKTFKARNPGAGSEIDPDFHFASPEEIDRAVEKAGEAAPVYRALPAEKIAAFLERIGKEIMDLGDELIDRAAAETGLGPDRFKGERGRTVNQLNLFAGVVREGSWVDARIDHAIPDRKPLPKPDVRRMLVPIGPVVVFGASNFPLAFSVAGGDTASALAAGCPVIVKAQRAHPGTSELVGAAVTKAAAATGMPAGVFSLIQGGHEAGMRLVSHPLVKAVGFTGSRKGGRALFDAACARPEPIPVYAEMGSANPVFILPGALKERGDAIAEGFKGSATLGVGQFCTQPGIALGVTSPELDRFVEAFAGHMAKAAPATMLHSGILDTYEEGVKQFGSIGGVKVASRSDVAADAKKTQASAAVFTTEIGTFLKEERLREEVFGPSTLVVRCDTKEALEKAARALEGHLTATVQGTEADLKEHAALVAILETKVGRILFNGFPTGVEVCPSMHHGGPWPATTFPNYTSVGTAAIQRFGRPVCWQSFPQAALPEELQDANPRGILRMIDGKHAR